jgi:TonB family protein
LDEGDVRRRFIFACPVFIAAVSAAAQQPAAAPAPADGDAPAPAFYYNDAEVTAPELLPAVHSYSSHHCKETEGMTVLGAVVDAEGVPSQLKVLRTAGAEIDRLAMDYAAAERFKPGVLGGQPVPVAVELELGVEACKRETDSPDGKKGEEAVLAAEPSSALEVMPPPLPNPNLPAPELIRQLGAQKPLPGVVRIVPGVTPPRAVNIVRANFSDDARKFKMQGFCLIELIVDIHGDPRNIRITKSLTPSLDQKALQAVAQYRFKPATKDGQPVPVLITVEVNFRLY